MRVFYVLILLISSCSLNKIQEQQTNLEGKSDVDLAYAQSAYSIDSLKILIVKEGDINAYKNLSIILVGVDREEDMLFYDLIMANRHGYLPAFESAFESIYDTYKAFEIPFSGIDEKTKSLMLKILNDGVIAGSDRCKKILEELEKLNE